MKIFLADEEAMVAFGAQLALASQGCGVIYLHGDLGAGKTTLCRGIVRAFGHQGAVKSPTYALVEPYELAEHNIYHFDLYRLGDPEELEFLGVRDYLQGQNLCLVEWPSRGLGFLPSADLELYLSMEGLGRGIAIEAKSAQGEQMLARLSAPAMGNS